jgi:hypothetical protein
MQEHRGVLQGQGVHQRSHLAVRRPIFRGILILKVVKRLPDLGVSLQQIRIAVQHLRDRGAGDLAGVTLMSDG